MKLKKIFYSLGLCGALLLCLGQTGHAQVLSKFQNKVTKFTLKNGLTFIVIRRPVAPVVSMVTFANVGSVNEPQGHTGLAHVFEHMAFKGTHDIGTKNWKKEKPVLRKEDQTYRKWLHEKYSVNPDSAKLKQLWQKFKKLQKKEHSFVINNQFSRIVQRNGGTGLNAETTADHTEFFYNLPENRLKLWFSLESDRFKHPVFREFYKEKKAIMEERRMRTESSPSGRLVADFQEMAYKAFPYHHPTIGWKSDIRATTMKDARKFFNTYYVPNNLTMAIAGDVNASRVKKLAKKYFGDMPSAPKPPPVYTKEPKQKTTRKFTIKGQSQPLLLMGYHTVAKSNPDFNAFQLLSTILSGGRTSILYKKMVQKNQSALQVQTINGFPGTEYPSMFLIFGVPNHGISVDSLQHSILHEIQKIKNGSITKEALNRAKTKARANLIRSLNSNQGLAMRLAQAQAQQGNWRKVFTNIKKLENVTLPDLQRVAKKYFNKDNLTIGKLVHQSSADSSDTSQ